MFFNAQRVLLFFALILSFCYEASADHLLGGEVTYRCLGNNTYEVTIFNFRDCAANTNFTLVRNLGVFNASGEHLQTFVLPRINVSLIDVESTDPCFLPPPGFCMESATYRDTITLPPIAGGYTLANLRCCIRPGITNMVYPIGVPEPTQIFTTQIPGPELADCNNSPTFDLIPPVFICLNQLNTLDFGINEQDGDSLVFTLCSPQTVDFQGFHPVIPQSPPFNTIIWEAGFGVGNQIPGEVPFQINSATGIISVNPNQVGIFNTAICVEEYRNGVLIATHRREFIFNVVACQLIEAVIPEQVQEEFCSGLTFTFSNQSVAGTNPSFFWDFGVPNNPNATSTDQEPTFTFPGPGEYLITLIVNPNSACPDTSTMVYFIRPEIEAQISVTNACRELPISFQLEGNFSDEATFIWDFGEGAPETSNLQNPTGIDFAEADFAQVSVEINDKGCFLTVEQNFDLFNFPTGNFTVDEDFGCQPFEVSFTAVNLQLPGASDLFWQLGDGSTATGNTISHIYTEAGIFDVTLFINSLENCITQVDITQNAAVTVGEKPNAGFTISPAGIIQVANPLVTVQSTFSGLGFCSFLLENQLISNDCNFSFEFPNAGFFQLTQVVVDEFGCENSFTKEVEVEGSYFFAPNAFTPNGDGVNDIFLPVVEDAQQFEMIIFDRYGGVVFRSNQSTMGWDGTANNSPAPVGVYSYRVIFRGATGENSTKQGTINLLR